ncbi:MAG: putative peptide modification system cyclase, partial [Rhodanobacteraceae bacterium]
DLKTRETVKLMQRDPEQTRIDRAIGSEVAIRDGARALILPTIAEIGGRVRITAEVIDPSTQTTVWSESADGVGAESVLPSLDKVNQKLRVRLGEALATVSTESQPLDKVATKNLDALRAYSLGKRAHALGNFNEAMAFFRQAVKVDPGFALAHAEIGQALSDMGDPAAALAEYRIASASRDHLAPRDALYVEALEASLGPAGTALEKWKQLTALYPDFFPGDGAYAMSLYEQANDYPAAINAATKSASPKNPHFITSKHLLGILYLGSERYKESMDAFAETGGIAVTQFRAAPYAVQRDYHKAEQTLGEIDASSGTGRRMFQVVLDLDQGRIDAATRRLQTMKAEPGRDQRRLHAAIASTRLLSTPGRSSPPELAEYAGIAERAAASENADFDDAQFHVLLAAYLTARQGDARSAASLLAAADPKTRDAAAYPMLYGMRRVADAEIARAASHPDQAIAILKPLLNGRELYVAHIALMDAYADAGDNAAALDTARWLATHRGRAFTEYGSEWVLVPFDVAQSNIAILRAAELELALGQRTEARRDLDAFRRDWSAALNDTDFAARANRVDAAMR